MFNEKNGGCHIYLQKKCPIILHFIQVLEVSCFNRWSKNEAKPWKGEMLGDFIPHGLKVSWNDHKVFRSAFLCGFFLRELNLAWFCASKRRFFAKSNDCKKAEQIADKN